MPNKPVAPGDVQASHGGGGGLLHGGATDNNIIPTASPRQASDRYPHAPGWKLRDTSMSAATAQKPKAKTMRARVLACLIEAGSEPLTPEQITERLSTREKPVLLMSIRPRCSELAQLGLISDSGLRGRGEGGCKAIRWAVVSRGVSRAGDSGLLPMDNG